MEHNGKTYSWLLLSPFSNQISFKKAGKKLTMQSSHEFNQFNLHQSFEVLLHAGATPLSGAVRYRQYLKETGQFSTLHDKIKTAPEGIKLIGATHIYLWGNTLLTHENIDD